MMSEYGEPWRCSEVGRDDAVFDQYGELIADNLQTNVARRIKFCVNACAELPQDALDGGWSALGMSRYVRNIEKQRDELLAALQESTGILEAFKFQSQTAMQQLEINAAIFSKVKL